MDNKNNDNATAVDISYMKRDIAEIKALLMQNYITRSEYEPVKKIVYGLVGLILVTVGGAILSQLITRG